jgi:hypothetical protein
MMRSRPRGEVLADLREALHVMEERSHLGLDNEVAEKLGRLLLHRIAKVESALAQESNGLTAVGASVSTADK